MQGRRAPPFPMHTCTRTHRLLTRKKESPSVDDRYRGPWPPPPAPAPPAPAPSCAWAACTKEPAPEKTGWEPMACSRFSSASMSSTCAAHARSLFPPPPPSGPNAEAYIDPLPGGSCGGGELVGAGGACGGCCCNKVVGSGRFRALAPLPAPLRRSTCWSVLACRACPSERSTSAAPVCMR